MSTEKARTTPPNGLSSQKKNTNAPQGRVEKETNDDVIVIDDSSEDEVSPKKPTDRKDTRKGPLRQEPKQLLKGQSKEQQKITEVVTLSDEEMDTLSASVSTKMVIPNEQKSESTESAAAVTKEKTPEKVSFTVESEIPATEEKSSPSEEEVEKKETNGTVPTPTEFTEAVAVPSTSTEKNEPHLKHENHVAGIEDETMSIVDGSEQEAQPADDPMEAQAEEEPANEDDWEDCDDDGQEGDEEDNGSSVGDNESVGSDDDEDEEEPQYRNMINKSTYDGLDEEKKRRADELITLIEQSNAKIKHMEENPDFAELTPAQFPKFTKDLRRLKDSQIKLCKALINICGIKDDSEPAAQPADEKDKPRTDMFAEFYSKFRFRGTGHKLLDQIITQFVRIVLTANEKKSRKIQGIDPATLDKIISEYSEKKLEKKPVLGPSGLPLTGEEILEGINRARRRTFVKMMSECVFPKHTGTTEEIKLPEDPELERKLRQAQTKQESFLETVTLFCQQKEKEGYRVSWEDTDGKNYEQSSDEEADEFDLVLNIGDDDAAEEGEGSGSCQPSTSAVKDDVESPCPSASPDAVEASGMLTDDDSGRENKTGSAEGKTGRKRSVSRGDQGSAKPGKIAKV